MITVSEALDHLFALAKPLEVETVPLQRRPTAAFWPKPSKPLATSRLLPGLPWTATQ